MSLILPQDAWPNADKVMWDRLYSEGDVFDGRGPLAHHRETSRKSLTAFYGRWLHWVLNHDPEAEHEAPSERASLPRLRAWLAALEHTTPMSQLAFVGGTVRVLRAAEPAWDWEQHRRLVAHLKQQAGRGTQTRKHGRVFSSGVLLDLGLELALHDEGKASTKLFRAVEIRDGAIIALLALMPMRRRALVNLRLGTSVFLNADRASIELPPELTKSGNSWASDVPEAVLPALNRYAHEARPFLLARGHAVHDHLWVARKGGPLGYDAIAMAVRVRTERALGVSVSPHFFRDAAATTLARHAPRAATLIRPILAHTSDKTAERHYNHAQTIEAGRDYAALIAGMKKEMAR